MPVGAAGAFERTTRRRRATSPSRAVSYAVGLETALELCAVERLGLFVRVIRRAHQRTRFHVDEAARKRFLLQIAELVRMVVPLHRRMRRRWSQVLADGQDRNAHAPEIVEHR